MVKNSDFSHSNRKRIRHSKEDNVDDALYQWFVTTTATNLPISGEMLRLKAIKFAELLGIPDFKVSNGFLDRWKKRHGIQFKKCMERSLLQIHLVLMNGFP